MHAYNIHGTFENTFPLIPSHSSYFFPAPDRLQEISKLFISWPWSPSEDFSVIHFLTPPQPPPKNSLPLILFRYLLSYLFPATDPLQRTLWLISMDRMLGYKFFWPAYLYDVKSFIVQFQVTWRFKWFFYFKFGI